jgi:hypothetical protein
VRVPSLAPNPTSQADPVRSIASIRNSRWRVIPVRSPSSPRRLSSARISPRAHPAWQTTISARSPSRSARGR